MSLRPVDPSDPSLNYSFSEGLIGVLAAAKAEAAGIRSDQVRPAHVLLGLLQTEQATGTVVLKDLHANLEEIKRRVSQSSQRGAGRRAESEDIHFTNDSKKLLHFALAEARELNATYVGTEHLLLGFFHLQDTIPFRALSDAGVSLEEARAETQALSETEEGFP